MRLRVCFWAIVLSLFALPAMAQVTTPHPRLILDAPTLTGLRASAASNTPQWQALKSYCDSFIGGTVLFHDQNNYPDPPNIGEGYQGSSYWSAAIAEGLCYQVTRVSNPVAAANYGAKAVDVLMKMSDTSPAHVADPCRDNGYGVRFFGVGMGLTYDWVYDLLSSAQRTQIYTTANNWLNTFETQGCAAFEYEHPQSNYFAGYFHAKAAIALATYGDNPSAPAQWTNWINTQFGTRVRPYYQQHLLGGGWPEGFGSYGPLSLLNMSLPAWEVKTATGTDLIHAAAPYGFPIESADYLMHFTWPSRDYIDDRDTNHASGDASIPAGTANAGMFIHVLGSLRYWNASNADVFRQYLNEVNTATSGFGADEVWELFLFADRSGTTRPVNTLPLSYFAAGMNAVAARSDWSTSASWMSFRAGPYTNNPGQGEEIFDQGSFALVRGKTPLVVNATGWIVHEPNGSADEDNLYNDNYGNCDGTVFVCNRQEYNVFYVRNMSGSTVVDRYGQAAYTTEDDAVTTHVAAHEDGGPYVYTLATKLQDMYRPFSGGPGVADWSRQIVYLRPNQFVVYDRTAKGNAGYDQYLAFHFPATPVAGSAPAGEKRFDVTYGATYAGAMTVVLPNNATTATTALYPPTPSNKVWQLQVRPPNSNVSQQWISVFDLATTTGAVATATPVNVTAGTAVGVLLAAAAGNSAVLSSTGTAGTPIVGAITYIVPAAATHHVITELTPNSGYTINVTPNAGNHTITITPVGTRTTSPKGVLDFNVNAAGVIAPTDRVFADGYE